ncbi:exosortase-associated protein EpsI, V-type [Sphingobium sp. B2D3B]|uniref:exosortase-associated protein EpsI, V-type n=1 Tax=Sphingobium sp. B2D3B TaxID=2940580 RepID=UPI0039B38DE8
MAADDVNSVAVESEPTPGTLSRRHLLMGGAMLAVSGLAVAREPHQRYRDLSDKQFEALFPKAFGDWKTLPVSELVLPPESDLANKLYQHILTRTYVNSKGVGVMFLAAYNSKQLNNVQLHRPEICYYAGGFAIKHSEPISLPVDVAGHQTVIPARSVTAVLGSRNENILYWTRIGSDFPQSWLMQRIAMTKANIAGYLADGLLVRMSVIDKNYDESLHNMQSFIADMLKHSGEPTRDMVVGDA